MDLWTTLNPIAAPAATDRVMFGTGSNAGGYSTRGEFIYRDASGKFIHNGATPNYSMNFADTNPGRGIIIDVANIAGAGLNGAMLSFTQNTIANMCFGMAPGSPDFAWYAYRNAAADGTELMRLTGAGRLGIGTSAPTAAADIQFAGTGVPSLVLSNTSWDRSLQLLATGGGFLINSQTWSDASARLLTLATGGVERVIIDGSGQVYPGADNTQALGFGAARWSGIYLGSNPIVTSDIRLKFYRAAPAPTPDEHAAILECFETFGFFQYFESIERETAGGSPARWHFGPKAQELWAIFAAHGLAAELVKDEHDNFVPPEGSVPPAFLCFDAWDEETAPVMAWWKPSAILGPDGQPIMVPCEEGEEGTEQRPTGETYVTRAAGNIFGVRIDQLQSLMLVALNKRMNDLADRVTALEPVP